MVRYPRVVARLVQPRLCGMVSPVRSGVVVLLMLGSSFALDNGLALTPPMGFNPWNSFGGGFPSGVYIIENKPQTGNGNQSLMITHGQCEVGK